MKSVSQTLTEASQLRQAGQLARAEQLYWSVLGHEPTQPEALHELGMIAHQRGSSYLALDLLTRAVASREATAVHWNNLGVLHGLLNQLDKAAAALEQALRLDPNFAETNNNLGTIRLRQGEPELARACFERALRCRPDYAEAHHNLGLLWQHYQDFERAAACHEQAIRIRPNYPDACMNLGIARRHLGEFQAAIAAFQQALAWNAGLSDASSNLGHTLEELGEHAQAVQCYRRALSVQPKSAELSNNLANALKEQGLFAEAVAEYRRTLTIQPDYAFAWYSLVQLAADGYYRFESQDVARLKQWIADVRKSLHDRSLLAFTLAGVLDIQDAVDEAFSYYRQANEMRKQAYQACGRDFNAHEQHALVDRLIGLHDEDYFRRVQGWGADSETPVFLIGMPRSGSSLVEQILSSHPQVHGVGELGKISRLAARQNASASRRGSATALAVADAKNARELADSYLQCVSQLAHGASRVVDKTLDNFLHLGALVTMFPRARLIHCRRDSRDIGLSCYLQSFQDVNFAYAMEDIGCYYREYERLMAHWSRVLPVPIHVIVYEDLVRDLETTARGLVAFCGLDWDASCLRYHDNKRPVRTASNVQVRQPLFARSVGRWKRYRAHLGPLLHALGLSHSNNSNRAPQDVDAPGEQVPTLQ
jgi:tetratricopeptide (TPR) repeat protein